MGDEWLERPLAELTDNFDGIRVPVKERDRRAGPYPYFGASGIVDYVDKYLFDGEYLLIAEDGENLRTRNTPVAFLARGKFWVNHAHVVRGNSEADTRFLMYALASLDIQGYLTGSTMPKLTQSNLNRIPLLTPPLAEQRVIAHVLGTLDDKIELNRRVNETMEAMARALFKSWFVDYDPVRAKCEGRDSGLPQSLADMFPDSFEESELGRIPRGWHVGTILDRARLLSGGTPNTDNFEYWGGEIPWASAKDVSQCLDTFLLSTERTITELGLSESATQLIPTFCSVVVARGATTGRMALLGKSMAMNQTCYALQSKTNAPFELYCSLRDEIGRIVNSAHGSVFDTITTSTFASSRLVIPPSTVTLRFEDMIRPLFGHIHAATQESATLSHLRDTLLPKLVSGEIRVNPHHFDL